MLTGRVTRINRGLATVEGDTGTFLCKYQKKLLTGPGGKPVRTRQTRPVAVGDFVDFEITGEEDREGLIRAVHERSTTLLRPKLGREGLYQALAANIDKLAVVASAAEPPFSPGLIDRFLIIADIEEIEPIIVVNKIDLDVAEDVESRMNIYRSLNYNVLPVSAQSGNGVEELRREISGKLTAFAGHSGVGKSSLLNALAPGLALSVRPVRESDGKGRHTTSSPVMVGISGVEEELLPTYVIDLPGVKEVGLKIEDRLEVALYFPEMEELVGTCRFTDCHHFNEPGCAILEAVSDGKVSHERWESYKRIHDSIEEKKW